TTTIQELRIRECAQETGSESLGRGGRDPSHPQRPHQSAHTNRKATPPNGSSEPIRRGSAARQSTAWSPLVAGTSAKWTDRPPALTEVPSSSRVASSTTAHRRAIS